MNTFKRKALFAAVLAGLALGGCGTMNMTPEQISAMSGTSSSLCLQTPGWNGAAVALHYSSFGGKSTGTAGGGGTAKCGNSEVTFANEGKASVQLAPGAAVKP